MLMGLLSNFFVFFVIKRILFIHRTIGMIKKLLSSIKRNRDIIFPGTQRYAHSSFVYLGIEEDQQMTFTDLEISEMLVKMFLDDQRKRNQNL